MSNLGDTIKSVLGGGHSSEAERGEVDHRTPGAFPRDLDVHEGVDQPRVGTKPIPSSGKADLGGTSEDPGFITGPSEHNKEGSTHNKLHKKDDPRGNTTYPAHGTSSVSGLGSSKLGQSYNNEFDSSVRPTEHNATNPFSSSTNPSSHNDNSLATDRSRRTEASSIPGVEHTGIPTGLPSRELGDDRSGHRTERLTDTSTGTTGASHDLTGRNPGSTGTSGLTGITGTGNTQPGGSSGHGSDHNKVAQRGVKSEVTSEEPYWGDLPKGAGVYNTVTGHGSGEDTSGQHRSIPRTSDAPEASRIHSSGDHHLPQGAGVYNTVTGHGSNRDAEEHTGSNSQREFPLSSSSIQSGETGTVPESGTARSQVDTDSHRDRHIGEAGALGDGAAAYGAYEHSKHSRDTAGPTTGVNTSGNREGDHGPHNSRIANALDPRVDSDRDGSRTTGNTTSGVSGTGLNSSTLGQREGDNHRDRHLGEAGVLGAGAAAYGAHEHKKHDREADRDNHGATQGVPGSGLESNTRGSHEGDSGPHNSRIANTLDPRVDSDRNGSRTISTTGTSSTGGTYGTTGIISTGDNHHKDRHLGEATALGAGAAAYGSHEHHKHPTGAEYNAQREIAPGASTTHHVTSDLDPTSTNQPRDTSHSGGLLHRQKDQTEHVPSTEKDKTSHHHEHSGILGLLHRNKDPKDVDQPAHDKSHFTSHHGDTNKAVLTGAPSTTQTASHQTSSSLGNESDLGSGTTRSGHDSSHTGSNLAGYGAAAGAGYGAAQLGHHQNKELQANNQYGSATGTGHTSDPLHAAVPGSHATTVTGQPHPLSGDNSSHAGRDLTGTTSHASVAPSSYSQESSYSQDPSSSHIGRNLAGAGAAAGAGYEASRLAKHHNEPSIGQPDSSLQGTPVGRRVEDNGPHGSRVANALDPRVDSSHDGNRTTGGNVDTIGSGTGGAYNNLSDGTPSGVAKPNLGSQSTSTHGNPATTGAQSTTSGDNYNHLSGGTPSGVAASNLGGQTTSTYGNQSGTTSQTESNSGDKYNHLSGGTPSGIAASTLGGQTTSTYGNQSGTASQNKSNSGDNYNHLSSGTPSGVQLDA